MENTHNRAGGTVLPLAHMAKATYYNGTGRPDLALVELDRAEKGNPSDEVFRLRGQILFELNRRDEAAASFDRAIEAGIPVAS